MANLVTLQGEKQPFIRNVMTLKSCAPIVGVDVMSFETERDVLLAWRVLILSFKNFSSMNAVWLKFSLFYKFVYCLVIFQLVLQIFIYVGENVEQLNCIIYLCFTNSVILLAFRRDYNIVANAKNLRVQQWRNKCYSSQPSSVLSSVSWQIQCIVNHPCSFSPLVGGKSIILF